MLQARTQQEKVVQRSLDRLQVFLRGENLCEILPALYYSSDQLMKYASSTSHTEVNYKYFREFKKDLENFAAKDLTSIKQHEREIFYEIMEIVNSDVFTQCLKPEIWTARHDQSQTMLASNYPQRKQSMDASLYPKHIENTAKNGQQMGAKLYQKLVTAYQEHRIDEAYALKNQYLSNNYPKDQAKTELFNTIELEYTTMMSFYVQFDQDGWIFDKEENGVTLQYKMFEEQKQIAIKIESEFDVSIENFLAILTEIDLMEQYVPFTYDTRQLKIINRNEKIGHSKIYIPLLTDRETYFYAAGYDRINKNGSVFVFSKTINEDKVYQKKYGFDVPEKSDYVRLEYIFFIVEYIPITKKRAKVRLASRVDLKLNFLPQFILNSSARKFAFDYFKNIVKKNKQFKGSPWEQRVKQNPEFYSFFRHKVEEYMGAKE